MTEQQITEPQTLELACAAVLDALPFPLAAAVPTKETFGVAKVGTDLKDLVDEHGAVVEVRRAGGIKRTWQTVARVNLFVYAPDYTDVWAAQDAIEARIGGPWRPNTTPGEGGIRIDSWRNESAATEQPYPGLSVLSSIWRVTTRHMPA
ncbi:MAG: hypothetical protein HOV78_11655 [Hamadaea sp.]|nr:hypothetical protein [Hamadaea sp.]